jgi:dihydropyrimidine dehydrogenase (NAD+) subunit PreT
LRQPALSHTSTDPLGEELPPLEDGEALVESQRCLYCYDAPCTHACPTHIEIPKFIKKINTGNLLGSAKTILSANLLGATCARVCPVQELCEGACVLGAEHNPIMIGRLQRYAMDWVAQTGIDVFKPPPPTGKRVAIIGAGAAGISCAGELAKLGHTVVVFEKRELPGGLSTYGIIGLREPVSVSLREVEMVQRLGVEFRTGLELSRNLELPDLRREFDLVFVATGLGHTPQLNIEGEEHIVDGLAYIERSKLDPAQLAIGENVLVIGAGNTAIDCATVAKRMGAKHVTVVYRRSRREVSAYDHEVDFALREGIGFVFHAQPVRVLVEDGAVAGLVCIRTKIETVTGRSSAVPGSEYILPADQIVKAIGQQKPPLTNLLGLAADGLHIAVDGSLQTSVPGIYAGGDAIRARGTCSTVMAVQDGKLAAASMHAVLSKEN